MIEPLIISRIQQRRGPRETLPTPLSEAELALTTDTGQVFMGDQDLAPFGIRAFTPEVSIETVNTQLSDRTVSCVFDSSLNQGLVNLLRAHIADSLPLDIDTYPNARFWNPLSQIQWDGARAVFLSLRTAEITAAGAIDSQWLTDPASAVSDIIDAYPGGFPVSPQRVVPAVDEFQINSGTSEPDWITQTNSVRILNFDNFDMDQPAGRAISRVVNLATSATDERRLLLNELDNIELAVVDLFLESPPFPSDVIVPNQLLDSIPASTGGAYVTGAIQFDASQSDVVFGDYSINGDGFAGTGTLKVIVVDGDVLVQDLRAAHNVPETGNPQRLPREVTISAQYNQPQNRIELIYRNSTPSDIEFRFIARRWNQGK